GLVHRECLASEHRSTPRTRRIPVNRPQAKEMQINQIRKLVADNFKRLEQKLAAIEQLQRKRIEGIGAVVERFLRQAHLYSRSLYGRLLEAWEEEGSEQSAFGVLNALTRVATHAHGMPVWQRRRLSRL